LQQSAATAAAAARMSSNTKTLPLTMLTTFDLIYRVTFKLVHKQVKAENLSMFEKFKKRIGGLLFCTTLAIHIVGLSASFALSFSWRSVIAVAQFVE